jgi:hypothetical protein
LIGVTLRVELRANAVLQAVDIRTIWRYRVHGYGWLSLTFDVQFSPVA